MGSACQCFAKSVFDDGGKCSSAFGSVLLGLSQQGIVQANGGSHTSRHTDMASICQDARSSDSFTPVFVAVALELDRHGAIGVEGLCAGPADGVTDAGFGFDFGTQSNFVTIHAGRQKK